ncbi:kinesin light chain [Colletotrichum graminicola M1.001]|uniref:Kinesin light chain n=1 Tax=Colletotrichum graminicola (strain M1.001 / M2 / FGSC 10212) TaxID=645133 RepID=E3QEW7_COLGM|nr:kinesin light chain [Colletotrichum graminicola M1.001]EFQ29423.1 kinesin light chain [Colletotrichum graminicola M1.001]
MFLGPSATATITPTLFVVPFEQNSDIVDRPDLFTKLDGLLPPVADYQSAALWGLGGSGKTQIALEFAYRRSRETGCSVYWVHADNATTFAQDYEKIASKAGLAGTVQGKGLLRAVREWIEAQPRWLLIIDNADDLSIFGVGKRPATTQATADEMCLDDYIPRAPVGTVLWTSRDQQIVGSLVGARRGVAVGRMTVDEATALFGVTRNDTATVNEKNAVSELLVQLDHLPLAVSQAAAYIRRRPTPVAKYLSRLKEGKKRWRVLKNSEHDRHRRRDIPNSILETWTISMEHIRQEDDMAYRILLTLAYVHNQNIPDSLIREAARRDIVEDLQISKIANSSTESEDEPNDDGGLSSTTSPTTSEGESDDDDDEAVSTAVARLREFSFLSERKDQSVGRTYDMHKLVQDAARYSLSQKARRQEAAQYSKAALLLVSDLFPPRSKETWKESEMWLPHASQTSEWAEACKAGTDEEIANLLVHVSGYLFDRGRWNEMEPVARKVFSLRQRFLGERDPGCIWSRANLALTYHTQGRYAEAEKLKTEVQELRQETLGYTHVETIESMAELALTYHAQGRYGKAEKIQKKVLELRQETLGRTHVETIKSRRDLAITYYAQGRYGELEKLKTEVQELEQQTPGHTHVESLWSMAKLAATYLAQGRHDEAEKTFSKVLVLHQEDFGETHPQTLMAMHGLAITYSIQRKYDEAEKTFSELLVLQQENFGKTYPQTLLVMDDLASTYHDQGRYDKAEKIALEVLVLWQENFGETHPDTVKAKDKLAAIYHSQGRYDEAEKIKTEGL